MSFAHLTKPLLPALARTRVERAGLEHSGLEASSLGKDDPLAGNLRRRAWTDIALSYGLILATIWTPRPEQQWFYLAATGWVVLSTWQTFPGWSALGFRVRGFLASCWVLGAAILLAAGAIASATLLHTLRQPISGRGFVMAFGGYVVWSFAQQFLLQSYFLQRFRQLLADEKLAALAAATIFAAAHLPNIILTPVTLIWGLCACFVFLRHRNIYPLAAAHAVLGICVAITVPGPVVHNMRVGLGYLRYHTKPAPPVTPPAPPRLTRSQLARS
jgi:Type II CAAX prenyl endopeptidase Rce1-like